MNPDDLTNLVKKTVDSKLDPVTRRTELILGAVIIVLFVGFFGTAVALGGVVVDGFRSKETSFAELASKVIEQDKNLILQQSKIDSLIQKVDNLNYKIGQMSK